MSCNTFHLINSDAGCYAIQRGVDLGVPPANSGIAFFVKNTNLTGWVPIGQIRDNYLALATRTIATFTFSTPTYSTFTLADSSNITGTKIIMYLPGTISQTMSLPAKGFNGDLVTAKIGSNVWLYDVMMESPTGRSGGVFSLVAPSYVQVTDDVSVLL